MENKIYVNGVDESGCEFVVDCLPSADCTLMNCFCYENTNCYYKQLKRKEKECEKLKQELENNNIKTCPICGEGFLSSEGVKLREQLQAEKEKVKELEEKLFQIESVVKPINKELPEDNVIREIMLILNDCSGLKPSKYKQALEEIRQIVIFSMEEVLTLGQKNATDEILQKCEVLDE